MKIQKSLTIALNIIFHSKLRSWLTIIGIIIGVASIISIVSIGSGFQKDIERQLGGLGSDIITVSPGFDKANECPGPNCRSRPGSETVSTSTKPLTNKEVQAIKSISEIQYVEPAISGSKPVYYLGETVNINIEGVDPSIWKFITTSTLESGRFLNPGDNNVVVIGSSIAKEMFKKEVAVNRQIKVVNTSFTVVGVLKKTGSFSVDDRRIIMPMVNAKDVLEKKENEYDSITIKVKDQSLVEQIELKLEKKLLIVRHVTKNTKDFTILSMKTIQEKVGAILAGFTLFLTAIAAVSLLVGAVGIANTMFTSVLERTKEIGVMKALGAKNMDIMLIFLFNSGLVGLVGGIIGTLFGILIAISIPQLGVSFGGGEPMTTSVSLELIIFTLVFSVVLGMVSGVIPAYRASKLRPVEALRSE